MVKEVAELKKDEKVFDMKAFRNTIKFKHERYNLIQVIHGHLSEDASIEAVKITEEKLSNLMAEIETANESNPDNFNESHALEMCIQRAKSPCELVVFLHAVCSASRCPTHPFISKVFFGGE